MVKYARPLGEALPGTESVLLRFQHSTFTTKSNAGQRSDIYDVLCAPHC